jgi:hypothetical protein
MHREYRVVRGIGEMSLDKPINPANEISGQALFMVLVYYFRTQKLQAL